MAWKGKEDWESQEIIEDSINGSYYLSIARGAIVLFSVDANLECVVTALLISCIKRKNLG